MIDYSERIIDFIDEVINNSKQRYHIYKFCYATETQLNGLIFKTQSLNLVNFCKIHFIIKSKL